MSESAAFSLAMVCEANADQRTAAALADRILCEEIDWLDPESLPLHRSWRGVEPTTDHLRWTRVRAEATERGIRINGHFDGEPGAPDAYVARLALLLLAREGRRPDAVLLIRDSDGDPRRQAGLRQAREAHPWPFSVLLGVANPTRECWVLHGFDPADDTEKGLLEAESGRLGFDPTTKSHKLRSGSRSSKRSAKAVLSTLVQSRQDREAACWCRTSLEVLGARGKKSGLAEFLREVREHLAPIFRE